MNVYGPGITIIVPLFNTESFIEECIASVIAQSYVINGGRLKLLCVDDASTDKGAEAAVKMFNFTSQVDCQLIRHTANRGLAAARNTGLRLVDTKYVMFLDSDDLLGSKSLEELHMAMELHQADVGIFEYKHFSPSNSSYPRNYSSALFRDKTYVVEDVESNLAAIHSLSACNKIYLTSCIDNIEFPEKRFYAEDVAFWFEVLSRQSKTIFIENALYLYRKREDSKSLSIMDSQTTDANNFFEYLDILEELRLKYQNSNTALFASISWFSQKSLFYYLVRAHNWPKIGGDRSRSEFVVGAKKCLSRFDIDQRLPAYQVIAYQILHSGLWRLIYLLGYAHQAKSLFSKVSHVLGSIRFYSLRRAYALFSISYLREIPKLLKYLLVARASENSSNTWLLGERGGDAGDNALALFTYLANSPPPNKKVYFVCSGDVYTKLNVIFKNVVLYGSDSHIRVFRKAGVLISTHSRGNIEPFKNKLILSLVSGNYQQKAYVFLGHGVTKDDMKPMLGQSNKRNADFDLFWCGSKMEHRDVLSRYGYSANEVKCAPLPRWQWPLHDPSVDAGNWPPSDYKVMIMFTWRSQFGRSLRKRASVKERFERDYLDPIIALLKDDKLLELHKIKKVSFHLVLHPETELTLQSFGLSLPKIDFITRHETSSIPKLIHTCDLLVTDYSSIAFDFSFYHKPTIYYQFDSDQIRKTHYQQGYFDYDVHGFGPVCNTANQCAELVEDVLRVDPEYFRMRRHLHFQHDEVTLNAADFDLHSLTGELA
ncbi:MAG: glycosyltransferase involved in cell wall biosynthesis [Flavobacterium sp.]